MNTQTTQVDTKAKPHPFERTLGQGPYRLVGFFALILPSEANQGRNNFHLAPKDVGCGTCAHCGHGIINNYIVQTHDGKKHAIGCDCIEKINLPSRELSQVKRNELRLAREQRLARQKRKGDAARIELKQITESQGEALKIIMLPNTRGNALEYANYCLTRSNDKGIIFVLNRIKTALGGAK